MKEGKVKFFNESRGFGFIIDASDEQEYFVHVSDLIDKIKENDKVTFELKEKRKETEFLNLKVINLESVINSMIKICKCTSNSD
jgi:CspA family cold shock protein